RIVKFIRRDRTRQDQLDLNQKHINDDLMKRKSNIEKDKNKYTASLFEVVTEKDESHKNEKLRQKQIINSNIQNKKKRNKNSTNWESN
ncbi:hypothetical protein A3Q56_07687, partial [Intoshia linei]